MGPAGEQDGAKWLGHDPAVLVRIYGHVYPGSQEAAGADLFSEDAGAPGMSTQPPVGTLARFRAAGA
ncbi:hypothetical protein [Nocardia brasiliensis]|uniref:hypothetical protein n=1 Tax=Nocardia brasiliensis TaxID=37326 RepID=UPI003D8DCA98